MDRDVAEIRYTTDSASISVIAPLWYKIHVSKLFQDVVQE